MPDLGLPGVDDKAPSWARSKSGEDGAVVGANCRAPRRARLLAQCLRLDLLAGSDRAGWRNLVALACGLRADGDASAWDALALSVLLKGRGNCLPRAPFMG